VRGAPPLINITTPTRDGGVRPREDAMGAGAQASRRRRTLEHVPLSASPVWLLRKDACFANSDLGIAHLWRRAVDEARPLAGRRLFGPGSPALPAGAANAGTVHDPQGFDDRAVEDRALSIKREIRALEDERLRLERRIRDLGPWGDISLLDPATTEHRLWFYILPHPLLPRVPDSLVWQAVHRDERAPTSWSYRRKNRRHACRAPTPEAGACLTCGVASKNLQVEIDELQAERSRALVRSLAASSITSRTSGVCPCAA
jgi:hypothetical protein